MKQDEQKPSSSSEYLYQQVADLLRHDIRDGLIAPGARLPSLDDLAERHQVNRLTVNRALSQLKAEGLVVSIPTRGTYVAETLPPEGERRRNGTLTVGLVSHILFPTAFGPYHTQIIAGMQDELGKAGGNLVLLPAAHVQPQSQIYDLMIRANLDAVIYLGPIETPTLRRMIQHGPPSVLVDFQVRGINEDIVLVDNRGGGYQAIEYLLSLGHRDIAVILGPEEQTAAQERLAGAREAIQEAGVSPSTLRTEQGQFTRMSGHVAMQRILKWNKRPTAVFCTNDEMAVGALQAIHRHSDLRIPEELSVMGFDDIEWANTTHPDLTTVHVDKQLMGRLAVQRLVTKLRDPRHAPMTTIIPTSIVKRGSTGLAPTGMPAGGKGPEHR